MAPKGLVPRRLPLESWQAVARFLYGTGHIMQTFEALTAASRETRQATTQAEDDVLRANGMILVSVHHHPM